MGSDRSLHVNVRVLCATNRELGAEIKSGRFRADLYHRLNVYPLHVPPLRERPEDIPGLAGHFCDLARRRLGLGPVRLSSEAIEALGRFAWPGNVRELENVTSRAVLRAAAGKEKAGAVVVGVAHLGLDPSAEPAAATVRHMGAAPSLPQTSLREATDRFQRDLIARTLAEANDNWAAVARVLGLHRSNLHRLAARLGLR